MSATDDETLPWLAAEKRLTAEAVEAGRPFWGVCLGVQLLAASLGANVYQGAAPEVGILPVTLTSEGRADPVFAGLPREVLTLQRSSSATQLPCRNTPGSSSSAGSTSRWRPRAPRSSRQTGSGLPRCHARPVLADRVFDRSDRELDVERVAVSVPVRSRADREP